MRIDLITALPDLCASPLEQSIVKRARASGLVDIRVHDLRRFAIGKHLKLDDYPFGGGAGMVLKPEPFFDCLDALQAEHEAAPVDQVIFLTPDGEPLTQSISNELSLCGRLVLIAGHYKGIDQRVRDELVTREISIGDYVLSGGELPALVLVDAVVRLIPGVLGDSESALSDSFQDGLLGAPTYTRPSDYRGLKVPDVLLTGDHVRIEKWREAQRLEKTRLRRPDLLGEAPAFGLPASPRQTN
jgi:tRNA (guanine37-N1)-methyltransferase